MRMILLSFVLAACASTPSHPAASPPHGQLEHDMRNCPSSLAGTTTHVTNTPAGVDLEITAGDPAVQQQIVDLAILHEQMGQPNPGEVQHTGKHGGPGSIGHCPVVHNGTTVTFARIAGGAVIHVAAMAPDDVARVQAAVADRVARLAAR